MANFSVELRERASKIRLLALDCDGVLTDGGVYIFEDGQEFRRFNIKDGLGLKQIMTKGIYVVIISGSTSLSVRHRAQSLGISEIYLGINNKLLILEEICQRLKVNFSDVAYIGDDLLDLPIIERVGLPCAPSDAHEKLKNNVLYITPATGGNGSVRNVCDLLVTSSI